MKSPLEPLRWRSQRDAGKAVDSAENGTMQMAKFKYAD
jgi:hypothetical protein